MRIAVMVIGLMLSVGLFIQSLTIFTLSRVGGNKAGNGAAGGGIIMALMWVIACALVIPFPRVSMVLFLFAALIGVATGASSDFKDLIFWGVVSGLLAVFSYFGYFGKRKDQAKEAERDALLRQAMTGRPTFATANGAPATPTASEVFCVECGSVNRATARYCQSCGKQLRAS